MTGVGPLPLSGVDLLTQLQVSGSVGLQQVLLTRLDEAAGDVPVGLVGHRRVLGGEVPGGSLEVGVRSGRTGRGGLLGSRTGAITLLLGSDEGLVGRTEAGQRDEDTPAHTLVHGEPFGHLLVSQPALQHLDGLGAGSVDETIGQRHLTV